MRILMIAIFCLVVCPQQPQPVQYPTTCILQGNVLVCY
jgi:hypothetical protein